MNPALSKLLRLAELRQEMAERNLRVARDGVTAALAARDQKQAELAALEEAQAQQAEKLREPALGSPQIRGALAAILQTFVGDQARLDQASAAIAEADAAIDEARQELKHRKEEFMHALRSHQKRQRLHQTMHDAYLIEKERKEDMEAEDRRYGMPGARP